MFPSRATDKSVNDALRGPGEHLDAMSSREYRDWLSRTMLTLRGKRTRASVGRALKVDGDRIAKWELRGSMPPDFYEQFAAIFDLTREQFLDFQPLPWGQLPKLRRGRPRKDRPDQAQPAA